MPENLVETGCKLIGGMIYHLPIKRSYEMKANLHHAFPEKDAEWRARVGKETSARLVEMTFFALATPFLSQRWFESHFTIDEAAKHGLRQAFESGEGSLGLIPHVTLFEMMSALPAVYPPAEGHPAVYRPLKQAPVDRWVRASRERWGVRLLSRREGLSGMMRSVRQGKVLGLLFDQNTGKRGCLFFFIQRVASATHLPGLLARRFDAPVYLLVPRRTGFWRAALECDRLPTPVEPVDLILTSHQRLEAYLQASESQAADWLWFHNRWGTHDHPRKRFFLRENDNFLERSRVFSELPAWPRRTRLWFRLPNWLGDVVMALPLIRAVRLGRPDAEIVLLAQPALRPLLEHVDIADRLIDLPDKRGLRWSYFRDFRRWKWEFPDCYLCLTNSLRGDLEAFLTGSPLRLGMLRPGKRRPFLTDAWKLPPGMDESQHHQLDVWEAMFRHFGLRTPLDKSPWQEHRGGQGIGLICGTENTPEKRWPVDHWRQLVQRFLENTGETLHLYGTLRDRMITDEVARGFDGARVRNLAGETTMQQFLERLGGNRVVICNDTGGMHLANLLGVPVIALFGPTNPVRTGPVFDSRRNIIQPRGCPPTGGRPIDEVTVDQVWNTWESVSP